MNTNKSIDFLRMYIKSLENNSDYRFIMENLCDYLDGKSKVFFKSRKGVSILKVVNSENNSYLVLEAYPSIFEIDNANMIIVSGNEKSKSVINFKLFQENDVKYLVNRLTFYKDDLIIEDKIEVFKNNELVYQLAYDKAKRDAIREVIINGEELIVRTSSDRVNDYLKYIKNNGKYFPTLSNKKEFLNFKNIIFNNSYNKLRKTI